jgi:competence protein ComEA
MHPGRDKVLGATWRALLGVVAVALVLVFSQGTAVSAAKANLVDINTATQAELEAIKGIGPVTAKKIIDNRPYKSLTELKKAGLSPKEVEAFKPSLTVTAAPAAAPAAKKTAAPTAAKPGPEATAQTAAVTPVDLNTADQKALETLPGVGPALAKRIIEARPFQSLDDLAKVKGLSKTKVAGLKDKVTLSAAAPAAPPAPVAGKPAAAPGTPATSQPAAAKGKQAAPKLAPGQRINLNTASQEDLEKLPEIGPVKAKSIIAGRPYKTPEDVMKVRGIKEGIYKKIKDNITVQ